MFKVSISQGQVVLKLEGAKKVLALKSTIKIPLKSIKSVSLRPPKWSFLGLRAGTYFPRVMMAGTLWTRSGKEFYYVRDPSKCVTLTLSGHEYAKVVFQVDNREKVASQISKALR